MKRTGIILSLLLVCAGSGFAFTDKTETLRDDLMERLNELRSVRGVIFSGRTFIHLNPVWGRGDAFTNTAKKNDLSPLMNLYMDVRAYPMSSLEIGARMKFSLAEKVPNQIVADNLYAEFIAFQFILIRFGQMAERFTPFTFWSETDQVHMRSELFRSYYKEDLAIKLMEADNSVPFQGIKVKFDLAAGEAGKIRFKAFGSKILDESTPANSYDRYLIGVMPGLSLLNDGVALSGVYLSSFDNTNSGSMDYNPPKRYDILSASAVLNAAAFLPALSVKGLGIEGEGALSFHSEDVRTGADPVRGSAWKANFFAEMEKILSVKAGYKQIAYEFVSPGAQTRFVTPFYAGSYFQNGEFYESLGFQPYYFMNYMRNNIQFTRDNLSQLNYTYAMGEATPNRQGLFGKVHLTFRDWITASADAGLLSEVAPVAAPNTNPRDFLRLEAEGSIDLKNILKSDFLPKLSGFLVMEDNKRDDFAATAMNESEDLKTMLYGAEAVFDFQLIRIVGVYQTAVLKGRKWVDGYDEEAQNALSIEGYDLKEYDLLNTVYGGGVIIRVSRSVNMQLDCLNMDYRDLSSGAPAYSFIQGRALITALF